MSEIQEFDWKWLSQRGNYMTLITPEIAAELMKRNRNNRRQKPVKIAQYARDMVAGHWDPDASDIKIDRNGDLVDGQNRLMASIRADVPFPTLLRTGLNPEAKTRVDTGAKRTASEALKMAGVGGYHAAIAAAISFRFRVRERVDFFDSERGHEARAVVTITHIEMLSFLAAHPALEKFAPLAETMRRQMPVMPVSAILAFLSMAAEIDEPLAHEFVYRLTHGQYGGPGDPIQALFEYAARSRTDDKGRRSRVMQEEHYIALTKVWNALRHGEQIPRLSVKYSEKVILPE